MKDYEKEGQLSGAVGNIINLIVGVGVSVMVLIFVGTLGGQTYNLVEPDINTISVYPFTAADTTVLNSTATSLGYTALQTTPLAYKAGVLITGNFTYDLSAGTATLIDNANNNTAFNFTGTYQNQTVPNMIKDGIISSFNALEQTGDYLPLIVLAVVIALVLSLVLGMGYIGKGKNNTAL